VHLAVLSSFALAQPVLDILGRNATFFAVRGSSSREIVVFALTLTLVPPAVLLLAELGARAIDPILGNAFHLFFVGALAAVVALEAIKDLDAPASALVLGAAFIGAIGAALYWEARFVRSILTVLAPAPLLFLALFLGNSQVKHLVFPKDVSVRTEKVESRTPIVFIMFDEFSTTSLMDRNQRIDAGRFPNFAALARDSTWFRSATTANGHTEVAVPSILAGTLPSGTPLPILADYPHNIFTLLGGHYRMRVMESLTRLCPRSVCKTRVPGATNDAGESVSGSVHALVSDVGTVYLHLLLPDDLAKHVPPTEGRWGNFGGHDKTTKAPGVPHEAGPCGRNICGFTRMISASRRPTFYFLHSILPHEPWAYLPSGRRYSGNVRVTPGLENGLWRDDNWLTLQAYQRYMLQLGDTDAGLGFMLKRLRSTGLYDRALVVVTADEGISFRPGEPARNLSRANLSDIAFVPLFVKLPGQRKPRIENGLARTISILPTIADAVHARIPWPVDGRSLLGARLPRDGTVSLPDQNGNPISASLSTLLAERKDVLERQVAAFGSGSPIEQVYRFGPHRELVGRRTADLAVEEQSGVRFKLDGSELLRSVDPKAEVVPSYLTGRIEGALDANAELAVAVNGTIAATTRSYEDSGETRFAAMVPDRVFRAGANDVRIFALRPQGSSFVLAELAGGNPTFVLRARSGGEVIESSDGQEVRVVRGALRGRVRAQTPGEDVIFNGSALDVSAGVEPDSIVVFVDRRSAYVSPADNAKRPGTKRAGFQFVIPRRLLPKPGHASRVRLFAIRGDVASELRYAGDYLTVGRG
jgi:hypothetical protein